MSTEVRRNGRGAWCVYVRGNFISDHATHEAARIAAKQIERAESLAWRSGIGLSPDGNDRRPCACGNPWVDSYVHVISPDHDDVGNVGWWRDAECRRCATQCGRWPLAGGAVVPR